jgi:hypothetical protein
VPKYFLLIFYHQDFFTAKTFYRQDAKAANKGGRITANPRGKNSVARPETPSRFFCPLGALGVLAVKWQLRLGG